MRLGEERGRETYAIEVVDTGTCGEVHNKLGRAVGRLMVDDPRELDEFLGGLASNVEVLQTAHEA
jgi:hypothetical protein